MSPERAFVLPRPAGRRCVKFTGFCVKMAFVLEWLVWYNFKRWICVSLGGALWTVLCF